MQLLAFDRSEFYCGQKRAYALARALVAMKSLASSSCSVMCGKPSQQARKRAIACVTNRLSSLARIASKESQRATKVTSGDSDLPEAKARTPRYPCCCRASSTSEERISWKSCTFPGRTCSCQTRACMASSFLQQPRTFGDRPCDLVETGNCFSLVFSARN